MEISAEVQIKLASRWLQQGKFKEGLIKLRSIEGKYPQTRDQCENLLAQSAWVASRELIFIGDFSTAEEFLKIGVTHFRNSELFVKKIHICERLRKRKLQSFQGLASILGSTEDEEVLDVYKTFEEWVTGKPQYQDKQLQPEIDRIAVPFVYRWSGDSQSYDPVSKLVRMAKFSSVAGPALSQAFGQFICWNTKKPTTFSWVKEVDYVVPVPLHRDRFATRGYNQAEILAKGVEEWAGLPSLTDVVERHRDTPDLRGLDRSTRYQAMSDAFRVTRTDAVQGRNVGIIDDVWTTGATMRSLGIALRNAGATKIFGFALCKTQSSKKDVKGDDA